MIASRMTILPATTGLLTGNLKKAQQRICEICREAAQRCKAYLQELLEAVQHNNDKG